MLVMRMNNDTVYDLKNVLAGCKKTASMGYRIAKQESRHLNETLTSAKSEIESTIIDFENSPCYVSAITDLLKEQLFEIRDSFDSLSVLINEDLANLRENLSKFSITLFGRTMAGKSTLMEYLKHGDGSSIGTGAQRTTRDIRKYNWNGMEITDVPGIGAFEGQDDEQMAFDAAKKADMVLFLITDDAPQASEAECFGKIIALGKPVVCIVNVKCAIREDRSKKHNLKAIERKFDIERLNEIRSQFMAYADLLGQEWKHISFINVHLQSAFLSQNKTLDRETANEFYKVSRIGYLEKRIIKQVSEHGQFYRVKTFVDAITNPMIDTEETLLQQSQSNGFQGRILVEKRRQLEKWKMQFDRDGRQQIHSVITKIKGDLSSEIAAFAEDHFSDKYADKAWERVLKERKIEEQCQTVLESLQLQCDDRLKEVTHEVLSELNLASVYTDNHVLKMNKIINTKRIWNWSTTIISGGMYVGATVSYLLGASLAGPLGWGALAVTGIGIVGSLLLESRDEKELEARRKLEDSLRSNVDKSCLSLEKQMNKNFDRLIENRADIVINELCRINSVVFRLADTQKSLAWKLNGRVLNTNKELVSEAIKFIGSEGLEYWIQEVARVPGNTTLLMLYDGKRFPEEQKQQLKELLSETINFVYDTENKRNLISRIIGRSIDRTRISVEEKIGVAHIDYEGISPAELTRIRLAQQLSQVLIIKQ